MEDEYKTKDLSEASLLAVLKIPFIRMDREGMTCWFIFKGKGKCQELSNKFFFGECLVNALSYYETMNRLKTLIYKK